MWSEPSSGDETTDARGFPDAVDHSIQDQTQTRTGLISKIKSWFSKDWTLHHLAVFLITFFSYALFHATRKTFSNAKSSISEDWRPVLGDNTSRAILATNREGYLFNTKKEAEDFEGILDTIFLSCYAVGLYVSGVIGDRYSPRLVLSGGMISSAILTFMFGCVPPFLQFYSTSYYVIVWGLCGFAQSTGWPTEVAVMGSWFGHTGRGLVLGIWSACASVGNIIGAELSSQVVGYGYEYAFLVSSTMLFCGGIVVFFGLVHSPVELALHDTDQSQEIIESCPPERPKAIGFIKAVLLPGVIAYSLAYACLKMVNYSFFFWLPYYLHEKFGWAESVSDQLSTYYDWGGIAGGIIGGIISDWLDFRTPIVVGMLLAAEFALFGYMKAPKDRNWNRALMAVAGFFVGGPANLISAAVSADLGKQPQLQGSSEALATVTGLVDGTGSVGAAIGQILVPFIEQKYTWGAVFYVFILMCFVTCLCLAKLCYKDIKAIIQRLREGNVPGYCALPSNDIDVLVD